MSVRSVLEGHVPYAATSHYDELFRPDGTPRDHYANLAATLSAIARDEVLARVQSINTMLLQRGVTFTVYAEASGTERIFPFDLIPRILTKARVGPDRNVGSPSACGPSMRFCATSITTQRILREPHLPRELVYSSKIYCREMIGVDVPRGVYIHVSGIDLIRDERRRVSRLEDNCRTPSGISYVLENRDGAQVLDFRDLFANYQAAAGRRLPAAPAAVRCVIARRSNSERPNVVVLTPGIYNSAYFEHTLLARRMGVELVEGSDLLVVDNIVYIKTTRGLQRVDVIYRRIDDDYLDPLYFRAGIDARRSRLDERLSRRQRRASPTPSAAGVADDKAIYRFVPEMIRFYLAEEPILQNVPTYDCTDETQRRHVIANLDKLVVKNTNALGRLRDADGLVRVRRRARALRRR